MITLAMTMLLGSSVFANESGVLEDPNWEKVSKYVSERYSELSEAEQAELTAEIYQEKYVSSTAVSMNADEDTTRDFVDIAYQNDVEQETYIVELISAHSGIETTTEAWEHNLNYLKLHYEEIMSIEGVNSIFVDLYIEAYESELAARDMPAEKVNVIRAQTSLYSAEEAVAYAEKYYDTYNPEYPDWTGYGGDCANFVSQCLYAGGKSMEGTPGTSEAAQNTKNWFSKGSSCDTKNVSSSWRGANVFKNYWIYKLKAGNYDKFSEVNSRNGDIKERKKPVT